MSRTNTSSWSDSTRLSDTSGAGWSSSRARHMRTRTWEISGGGKVGFEEAVKSYGAVLEIDPGHALAYAGLGDALFRLGRHGEAAAALTRSLALRPRSPMAGTLHVLLGQTLQELARFEEAAEHFTRGIRSDPRKADVVGRLAVSRFGQKRYREARDLFRALVSVKPDDARAHSNLGAALYHLGRPGDALRGFERALALDPSLKTARTGLQQARQASEATRTVGGP